MSDPGGGVEALPTYSTHLPTTNTTTTNYLATLHSHEDHELKL